MRKKIAEYLIFAAIIITFSVAITHTESKYIKTDKFILNLETASSANCWTYTDNPSDRYAVTQSGYYAVLLKGGGGGNGNTGQYSDDVYYPRNNTGISYCDGVETGGAGGIVLGVIKAEAGDVLGVYLGSQGGDALEKGQIPTRGTNPTEIPSEGSTLKSLGLGGTGKRDTNSNNVKFQWTFGGGGGAASILYKNNPAKENVLMIAAGGGASAGRERATNQWAPGRGGSGGSNIPGFVIGTAAKSTKAPIGSVYSGADGTNGAEIRGGSNVTYGFTPSGTLNTYGRGATVDGGAGTKFGSVISSYDGERGVSFSESVTPGCGGSNMGQGGAGGGGYSGGGSGGAGFVLRTQSAATTDSNKNPGGGGGGSSFLEASIDPAGLGLTPTQITNLYNTLIDSTETDGGKYDRIATRDGFVIIAYIGENLSGLQ